MQNVYVRTDVHTYYFYINLILYYTVDPHLSEHLGTKGWLDMRNVQITETGLNTLRYINILLNIMLHFGYIKQ